MVKSKKSANNLILRIISGAALIPVVLLVTFKGGVFFNMFIILVAILMSFEWAAMTHLKPSDVLDINSGKESALWKIIGVLYILLPTVSLIWIRQSDKGANIVLWIFAIVWMTDICAFFTGKQIGGPKLAPSISPNKTWSGLLGGIIGASLTGFIFAKYNSSSQVLVLTIISGSLAIYAQIGDLVESWVKRKFKVKDSGKLIPGHGGVLDRVDGIVTVAPKVVLIMLIDNYGIF